MAQAAEEGTRDDGPAPLALLKIERPDLPSLVLTGAPVSPGMLALALGAQDGASLAALGVVALASGPWRSMRGGDIAARIELDVRLRASAMRGVALDPHGRAVGMLVEGPRRRTLVIPAETIERIASMLRDEGHVARGYLGLGLRSVAVDGGGAGAIVMSLDQNGPGAAAGVRQGDVILAVDGAQAQDVRALIRGLGPESVGRIVTLAPLSPLKARFISLFRTLDVLGRQPPRQAAGVEMRPASKNA